MGMSDAINPKHYDFGDVQPVDIAEYLSFNLGNVVKYVSRAGRKGEALEDLEKARWYLDREIGRLGGNPPRAESADLPVPRLIENYEGLESILDGAVVRDGAGSVAEKERGGWWVVGDSRRCAVRELELPVTVLWGSYVA